MMNTALVELLIQYISHRVKDAERAAILDVARWYELTDDDLGELHRAVWKEIRKE